MFICLLVVREEYLEDDLEKDADEGRRCVCGASPYLGTHPPPSRPFASYLLYTKIERIGKKPNNFPNMILV